MLKSFITAFLLTSRSWCKELFIRCYFMFPDLNGCIILVLLHCNLVTNYIFVVCEVPSECSKAQLALAACKELK